MDRSIGSDEGSGSAGTEGDSQVVVREGGGRCVSETDEGKLESISRNIDHALNLAIADLRPLAANNILFDGVSATLLDGVSISDVYCAINHCSIRLMSADIYKFWIGDIILQSEDILGEEAAQAWEFLKERYSYETIDNIIRVSQGIPPENRKPFNQLSWSAQRETYAIRDKEEQKYWLDRAVEHHWKTRDLKAAITDDKKAKMLQAAPEDRKNDLRRVLVEQNPTPTEFKKMVDGEIDIQLPMTFDEWLESKDNEPEWKDLTEYDRLRACWEASRIHDRRAGRHKR